MYAPPIAQDVARFLGRPGEAKTVDLANEHLPIVTQMVKAYTRGRGFGSDGVPALDVTAVIVSATARVVNNPESTIEQTAGQFSTRYGVFNGWTLPELAILHRHRKRAH